jgi:type I restriction-modification system DNA methylase subunit
MEAYKMTRELDIDHVMHAFKFLKPGGKLVSVMSAGITFRQDRKAVAFREMLEAHNGQIIPLPEGSFKESGTGVNAVIVTVEAC